MVKFLTTSIRAKVSVGVMVGEGRKASIIKKFDITFLGFGRCKSKIISMGRN